MINDLTRHSLWLSRYYNGIFKEIEPELKKMRDEISQQILSSTPYQSERLSILLREINAIIDRTTERINPSLFDDFAEYEQSWTLKLLDKSTVASVVIGTGIAPEQLKALISDTPMTLEGKKPMTIEELVAYFNESAKKQIKEEITRGLVEGKTTDVIAKEILQFTKDRTFQQAKATVLTIANHVGNVAMRSVFEEHEELFKGEIWHTVLDGRATETCIDLSGKIFKVGQGRYPPAHFRCRSKRLPILKDKYMLDIPDRTQSSQYGQVPADWTYNDWLKHQSVTVQNEILGDARANAYRKSGESINKFIDDGRFYTLKELREIDLIK